MSNVIKDSEKYARYWCPSCHEFGLFMIDRIETFQCEKCGKYFRRNKTNDELYEVAKSLVYPGFNPEPPENKVLGISTTEDGKIHAEIQVEVPKEQVDFSYDKIKTDKIEIETELSEDATTILENWKDEMQKNINSTKHNDRNDIMEIVHNIMNLCHAEYHLCETIQINKDMPTLIKVLNEQLIAVRQNRVQAMLILSKYRPVVKGLWCVVKHLLLSQFHSYEIYERTQDKAILEIAHNTNLILDELLAHNELSQLRECPRCKDEKDN